MSYILLMIFGGGLSVLLAFLVYWSAAHWILKACALSIFLSTGISALMTYDELLGHPIQKKPDEFVYIFHIVTPDDTIIIWAYTMGPGYRLYEIPYDRETAIELEKAKQRSENGARPETGQFDAEQGALEFIPGTFEMLDKNQIKD